MSRALVRLALGPAAPTLLLPRRDVALVSPFGRWLREELIALRDQWPAATFQRLRLGVGEVTVVVEFDVAAPPLVAALALMRHLQQETQASAQRVGWLAPGERMWGRQRVVVLVPFRSARASTAPGPAGRRSHSSTTRPARER